MLFSAALFGGGGGGNMAGGALSAALGCTVYPGLCAGGAAGACGEGACPARRAQKCGGGLSEPCPAGPGSLGPCVFGKLGRVRSYGICRKGALADERAGGGAGAAGEQGAGLYCRRARGPVHLYGGRHGGSGRGNLRPAGPCLPVGAGCGGRCCPEQPGFPAFRRHGGDRNLFYLCLLSPDAGLCRRPASGGLPPAALRTGEGFKSQLRRLFQSPAYAHGHDVF